MFQQFSSHRSRRRNDFLRKAKDKLCVSKFSPRLLISWCLCTPKPRKLSTAARHMTWQAKRNEKEFPQHFLRFKIMRPAHQGLSIERRRERCSSIVSIKFYSRLEAFSKRFFISIFCEAVKLYMAYKSFQLMPAVYAIQKVHAWKGITFYIAPLMFVNIFCAFLLNNDCI